MRRSTQRPAGDVRIDSSGQNAVQLTTDGAPDPNVYESPSASADGTRPAFRVGTHAYASDANAQNRVELDPGHFHLF